MSLYMCLKARLVADPITKEFGENKLTEFRIADNPMSKVDKNGKENPARFVTCKVWGKQATSAARLAKGDTITLYGELSLESYTNKAGQEVMKDVCTVTRFDIIKSETYFAKAGNGEFKPGQIPF